MSRIYFFASILLLSACSSGILNSRMSAPDEMSIINTNQNGRGDEISCRIYKGEYFYYPLMAIWVEDKSGNYIQSLYVPVSVATGIFRFGKAENNKWVEAEKRAPQTLPFWAHKRGTVASDGLYMPDQENRVPDAYSGATPVNSFVLNSRSDIELPDKFRILLEINQNWDWNEYWTNDKFPEDENYKMSCQPALVYEVFINKSELQNVYHLKPIGHSHYSGKTGELFTDLSTITTALHIVDSIVVSLR